MIGIRLVSVHFMLQTRPVRALCFLLLLMQPCLSYAQAPGVIVDEVRVKSFPLSAEALGNARANESIEVRTEITAALKEI